MCAAYERCCRNDCPNILPNMEIKRKTTIEIEQHRRFSLTQPSSNAAVNCPSCATTERMVTAEHCAATFDISRRMIYQLVEAGAVHFAETEAGMTLLCVASLAAALRGNVAQLLPASPENPRATEES